MGDQDQFFKRIAIASLIANVVSAIVGVIGVFCIFHPLKQPASSTPQAPYAATSPSTLPGPGENLPIDSGNSEESSGRYDAPTQRFWGDDAIGNLFRLFFSRPLFWVPAVLLLLAGSQVLKRWGNSHPVKTTSGP
jgi:hypothetical protein